MDYLGKKMGDFVDYTNTLYSIIHSYNEKEITFKELDTQLKEYYTKVILYVQELNRRPEVDMAEVLDKLRIIWMCINNTGVSFKYEN